MKYQLLILAFATLLLLTPIQSARNQCPLIKSDNVLFSPNDVVKYNNLGVGDGIITNQALNFDDSSKYGELYGENIEIGDGDYTFSFWVHFNSHQDWQRVIDWHNVTPNLADNIIICQQGTSQHFQVEVWDGGNKVVTTRIENGIRTNRWDHYVVTIENNLTISVWRNGENISDQIVYQHRTANATFPRVIREKHYVGRSAWDANKRMDGLLDEFYVFEGKLTDAEILCLADRCSSSCEKCSVSGDNCTAVSQDSFTGRSQCDTLENPIFDQRTSMNLHNIESLINGYKTQQSLPLLGNGYGWFPTQTFGGDLTISFWAKLDGFVQQQRFMDFSNGQQSDNIIIAQDVTKLYVSIFKGNTKILLVNVDNILELDSWNHFVVTIGQNLETKIYKNAVEQTITVETQSTSETEVPTVERRQNWVGKSAWNDGLFLGEIDEFLIYNQVLSTEQIRCLSDLCDSSSSYCDKCAGDSNTCGGCVFNRELPGCSCPSNTLDFNTPECKPFSQIQTIQVEECNSPRELFDDGTDSYCICSGNNSDCSAGQTYDYNTCQCV